MTASQTGGGNRHTADPPPSLERKTAMGRAIARSSRADCRDAHAGAGLLALPLLARDALLDKGCRW